MRRVSAAAPAFVAFVATAILPAAARAQTGPPVALERTSRSAASARTSSAAVAENSPPAAHAETSPTVAPAQCDGVDADAASKILGYPVGPVDARSRSAGICFFPTKGVTDSGLVSYAAVTFERLPQRRAYFAALARMCAGVARVAPRAALCATYVTLSKVQDLDEYFSARTAGADAVPVLHLGDAAFAAGGTLYVRRPAAVFEIVVKRDRTFDLARSVEVAKLLLARPP